MVQKEQKYYVFKKEEMDKVLSEHPMLSDLFKVMANLIRMNRIARNKKPDNSYIVCNDDEPYAAEVWKIILDGEKKKEEKKGNV